MDLINKHLIGISSKKVNVVGSQVKTPQHNNYYANSDQVVNFVTNHIGVLSDHSRV